MKTTVSSYDFHRAFEECRPENFSYEGLQLLFDYFEQFEDDTGEEIELDVIAICCEYSEDSLKSIADSYAIYFDPEDSEDAQLEQVKAFLESESILVGVTSTGSIVYQQF